MASANPCVRVLNLSLAGQADKDTNGNPVCNQDLEAAIPEAIEPNDTGYLHLNNDPILWTMLNGIKELNQKLEEELQRRDGENVALKARLERLEQLLNQKLNGGAK